MFLSKGPYFCTCCAICLPDADGHCKDERHYKRLLPHDNFIAINADHCVYAFNGVADVYWCVGNGYYATGAWGSGQ